MTDREGTHEPGGADEIAAARDALHHDDAMRELPDDEHPLPPPAHARADGDSERGPGS